MDQVIIACFADQSLTKGCKTTSQRAARVLDAVNNRLSALAADLSVTPTRYGLGNPSLSMNFPLRTFRTGGSFGPLLLLDACELSC